MPEPAPFDVDALMRRVRAAAQADPSTAGSASPAGGAHVDDHADALAAALRRCAEAFDNLAKDESRATQLSWLAGRRRPGSSPADDAMRALRDVVNRLDTRHRHDIVYLLEHVAELERQALLADDLARRVALLERPPDAAVVDVARFANWFGGTDLVLWTGVAEGPLHDAVARAGPVTVYEGATSAEGVVGAAVIAGCPVTATVADQVGRSVAAGGLLVVTLDNPGDLPAVVDEVEKTGFDARRLTWLADAQRGIGGLLVATFHRRDPR